jgi:hypothetical protein
MNKYQIKVTKPDFPNTYVWLNILDKKERKVSEYIRINPNYNENITETITQNITKNNTQNITQNITENIAESINTLGLFKINYDNINNIEKFLNLSQLSIFRSSSKTIYDNTNIFNKIDLTIFNKKQKETIKKIVLKITREDIEYLSITGCAGSGKSFTIIEMFKKFKKIFLNKKIAFVGPTNIIVNKFKENHNNIKEYFKEIKYLTVSGLLAEKPKFDSNGKRIFKPKYDKVDGLSIKNKKQKTWDKCFDILIFDESSMIENEKLEKILDIIKNKKLKTVSIFVGDKNQLNPVNENENFILENPSISLEKNMRCNIDSLNHIYNDIVDEINIYNESYNYINLNNFISQIKNKLIENNSNIKVFNDKNEFIKNFINIYKEQNSIITTYTNKECDYLNSSIKNLIVSENKLELVDKYYIGQQIIFMEPYLIKLSNYNNIIYNTSELAQIVKINKKHIYLNEIKLNDFKNLLGNSTENCTTKYNILTNYFDNLTNNLNKIFELFNTNLKFKGLIITLSNKKNNIQSIEVLNSKDENKINDFTKQIENEINNLKKKYKKQFNDKKDNNYYINLLNDQIINNLYELLSTSLGKFAKLNDGYALTVHKSQGITVNNIYVNLEDILTMTDIKNKLKCIYTSFTRCSDNLVVYLLDNPICKCNKYSTKCVAANGDIYWKCIKCAYFKYDNIINNELKII